MARNDYSYFMHLQAHNCMKVAYGVAERGARIKRVLDLVRFETTARTLPSPSSLQSASPQVRSRRLAHAADPEGGPQSVVFREAGGARCICRERRPARDARGERFYSLRKAAIACS